MLQVARIICSRTDFHFPRTSFSCDTLLCLQFGGDEDKCLSSARPAESPHARGEVIVGFALWIFIAAEVTTRIAEGYHGVWEFDPPPVPSFLPLVDPGKSTSVRYKARGVTSFRRRRRAVFAVRSTQPPAVDPVSTSLAWALGVDGT